MINETLRVQRPEDRNPGNYSCRVENVSGKTMIVTLPTDNGTPLPVYPEQTLGFSIVRGGNAYYFSGQVDNVAGEQQPLVTVTVSSAVERVQRRQDFRVKCLIPLEVIVMLPETSSGLHPATLRLKTNTYDLSASGVSLLSATVMPSGALPVIKLSLPDGEMPLRISCRVAHCFVSPEVSGKFLVGTQFMNLAENDRTRIVRFVYRTQLKRARAE